MGAVDQFWWLLVGLWVGVIVGVFALALGASAARTPPRYRGGVPPGATENRGELLHSRVTGLRARLATISRHLRRLEAPAGRLPSRRAAGVAAEIRAEILMLARELEALDALGTAIEDPAPLRSAQPAVGAEASAIERPERQAVAGTHGPVLVVEDDAPIRELVATALQSVGFEVLEAADGIAALELVERRRPAAIVLDLALPRMDGATFADELRRRQMRPGIPIVVLSAAPHARRQATAIGAEACLSKPFQVPELVRAVAQVAA